MEEDSGYREEQEQAVVDHLKIPLTPFGTSILLQQNLRTDVSISLRARIYISTANIYVPSILDTSGQCLC